VASRAGFDGQLLDAAIAAGAAYLRARVTDVVQENGGFDIALANGDRCRVAFVIGADGPAGICRARLTSPFERRQLSVATGFFAHGASDNAIVIEFVDDPPGYIWSFPRPDHLAIGICAQADACSGSAALRARLAQWTHTRRIVGGGTLQPYSWPIPSLAAEDFDQLPVSGRGWMLVGDAAGLVDPITREGIYFALQSAEEASQALLSGATTPEAAYQSHVRDTIGEELMRAARLKRAFFRPAFTRLLLDALAHSEAIGRVMADLVAGAQGYRGLKRRLLRTWEVGLAVRLLLTRPT
jgi:flavin-dependent dehydrogenase